MSVCAECVCGMLVCVNLFTYVKVAASTDALSSAGSVHRTELHSTDVAARALSGAGTEHVQSPHPLPRNRSAGSLRGDVVVRALSSAGTEHVQSPHPLPGNRSAGSLRGDQRSSSTASLTASAAESRRGASQVQVYAKVV